MRNTTFTVIILLLSSSSAVAQELPWAQKLFRGVTNHDFGTCARGAQLKHRFHMKNIYAVPLEITDIRVSCGCVSFHPSKRRLEPHEEGYIDIVMDGRRFNGHKSVNLYITVGPQYISTAVINITANARTDVVFNPGEVNFGVVPVGSTPTQTIDVEYAGNLDWRILEIQKPQNAAYEVTPRELYRESGRMFRSGKVGYQLALTIRKDAQPGAFREHLLLKTNDPNGSVLTVPVQGTIQASLTARPERLDFGTVQASQTNTQKVIVRGQQPFKILSIEGAGNGIDVTVPTDVRPVHVLEIRCQPTQPGNLDRELRIHTNLGGGEVVSVHLRGKVVQ